ncbi:hypothetical protein H0A61_03016 [Koleobacter methoxysyntrophicus]|uniref:TadE-like protein n=2 Tax=Koleobacter methoxysyntrophicus TaxID=2751313 RepID=A0A8A0RTY7_9FIRM|nr:hypothetical protein [Koleobacter methoxysyntrophicus]QSQ10606.1 hypothetical protein H0A61_03016 [Koleobacter methoxysyntrophicus]
MNNMLNRKGSAEIIGFLLILPFLLLPIINTVNMLGDLVRYDALRLAAKQALLRMEIEGGMTEDGMYILDSFLQSKNIDPADVHVDCTPYPVNYGEEVRICLTYQHRSRRYYITLTGLRRVEKDEPMVYGPISSVSKRRIE